MKLQKKLIKQEKETQTINKHKGTKENINNQIYRKKETNKKKNNLNQQANKQETTHK